MNRAELIAAMSQKADISKKDAEACLKAFEDVVTEQLEKHDDVTLVGFGKFEAKFHEKRMGRNVKTGESIEIAAKYVPTFKAGKALAEKLNK